jgi:hypothetical protein
VTGPGRDRARERRADEQGRGQQRQRAHAELDELDHGRRVRAPEREEQQLGQPVEGQEHQSRREADPGLDQGEGSR